MNKAAKITNLIMLIIFLLYGILDAFGLFGEIAFLQDKALSLILVALSIFLFSHLNERNSIIENIQTELTKVNLWIDERKQNDGIDVEYLNTSNKLFTKMAKSINNAKASICDLTWGEFDNSFRTSNDRKAFKKYYSSIQNVIEKPNITYREIMTFPNDNRIARVENIINKAYGGYKLKYFSLTPEEHKRMPPLLQFTIIDNKEVFFTHHRGMSAPIDGETFFVSQNKILVDYFLDYFNAAWNAGKTLIDTTGANMVELEEIKKDVISDGSAYKDVFGE